MNVLMREEVLAQIKNIKASVDIDSLRIESGVTVFELIDVLEQNLFARDGAAFAPALHLFADRGKGIDESMVARDKRKVAIYKASLDGAMSLVESLLDQAAFADAFNKELDIKFPKKVDSNSEISLNLIQLLALLQSYLDFFKSLESGTGTELSLDGAEAAKKFIMVEKQLKEILIGQEDA